MKQKETIWLTLSRSNFTCILLQLLMLCKLMRTYDQKQKQNFSKNVVMLTIL